MNPNKSQSKRKTKSQSNKQPLNQTLHLGSSSSSNDGINKISSQSSSKKRAGTTSNSSSSNKKSKANNNDDTTSPPHPTSKEILGPYLPIFNGKTFQQTPPANPKGLEKVYAHLYLKYVKRLQVDFPENFTNVNISNIETFENDLEDGTFKYQAFRDFIKGMNSKITLSDAQRERINELNRKKSEERWKNGRCNCGDPVCETNRAKCLPCSEREAAEKRENSYKAKEEGINCHRHLQIPLRFDRTCSGCSELYCTSRKNSIELFLKHVEKKETTLRTFHSVNKFMTEFNKMGQKEGAEWYKKKEPLELLCHSCHSLEHARNIRGDSIWAEYHRQVITLLGGKCQMCELSLNELIKEQLGLGMILHVHHLNMDGREQRKKATNETDDDGREAAENVNEYKAILEMEDEEREEKLKTLQCLCSGCHYFVHMERNTRSLVMENEEEKERMLHGLRFQRLLNDVIVID